MVNAISMIFMAASANYFCIAEEIKRGGERVREERRVEKEREPQHQYEPEEKKEKTEIKTRNEIHKMARNEVHIRYTQSIS